MRASDLPGVDAIVRAAVAEDLGRGDLTTRLTVPARRRARARMVARQDAVLTGLSLAAVVFAASGGGVTVSADEDDGRRVSAGECLCTMAGPARALLSGERVALNLVQQLSGVSTLTRRFVDAVAGTGAGIVDTRKTVPGLRLLQKHAVRAGGGRNHRFGLDDGILIKENHIAAAGGLEEAVRRARAGAPHGVRVEVECETEEEVDAALVSGADVILLDNMSPSRMAEAVRRIAGRAVVEASGSVTLESVRAVAESGVDLISVGALTHSAPAIDVSMELEIDG